MTHSKETVKKIIIFLLLCSIVIFSVACTETEPTITEVELTTDNIKEYLNISGQYGEVKENKEIVGSYYYLCTYDSDFTLITYSTVPGSFSNVSITLEVTLPFGWKVAGTSNGSFSQEKGSEYTGYEVTITITLPTDGKTEKMYALSDAGESYLKPFDLDNQEPFIRILSVTGTFTPAN